MVRKIFHLQELRCRVLMIFLKESLILVRKTMYLQEAPIWIKKVYLKKSLLLVEKMFHLQESTVNKVIIRQFFLRETSLKWNVKTCDIKIAFLKGPLLEWDFFCQAT